MLFNKDSLTHTHAQKERDRDREREREREIHTNSHTKTFGITTPTWRRRKFWIEEFV
jgi:hypothetical protein